MPLTYRFFMEFLDDSDNYGYFEEEEENDPYADIAIKTHELRADKIRLQEKLEFRKAEINDEIRRMTEKLSQAQQALSDAEYSAARRPPKKQLLDQYEIDLKRTTKQAMKKTTTMLFNEKELYSAKQKLELLMEDFQSQKASQKKEIDSLMRKARRKKSKLEARIKSIEDGERRNDEEIEENQDLQIKIHQIKRETKAMEIDVKKVEDEVMELIQEAETIVSKKYRGRSKHIR
ncbi:Myh10 protein [Tritrichomonas foetus]|uniref:Myh10 protein n=1 Tax=Tritrichomonas foetus TaxID=1144522 RepID=A0A1J4J4A0_9EUKA|nr:Myh10 protein [Tritrichomonas foetus]|eukprot:OHS93553.1 Myh10 protein [Tritrichomonas foetus]